MQGDTDKSIRFLKKWSPKGNWILVSIAVDKKNIDCKTFSADTEQQCADWINKYNGTRNIYFHVNETFSARTSKANKVDIKNMNWLHVDSDPEEGKDIDAEKKRILDSFTSKLPRGIPAPTVIIYSGGGYQAFWKLKEPVVVDGKVTEIESNENYNIRLSQVFGGDHCHNLDRIMRLPGTVNIPDAKKKKKGRTAQVAKLLAFEKHVYDLSDFQQAQASQSSAPTRNTTGGNGPEVNISGNIEPVMDLSELDEWSVPDRTKVIISQGHHPDQPKEKDNSRSAWVFDCVCNLVRCGVPDDVIFSILTDKDWEISRSVLEQKSGAQRYATRQIQRAKEWAEEPELTKMNDRHAVIGNIGGKCRIIEEVEDDILKRSRITLSSFEDIGHRYNNIKVQIGQTNDGAPVLQGLGKFWLNHRMRRQYDTMRFLPMREKENVYNLWRGFNVEARPNGRCDLYLQHIKENVCSGNEEHYEYLIKWMARAVQRPATAGQVAVVLQGEKGTGKGSFAGPFGRLWGRHYLHVANPSHLVGNFNAHLRDVVVLFADEAFFAGDKKHESVLKMLITEDSIPIEAKGIDTEPYPNFVHMIMASNDGHVIRATGDERRYFVLQMGKEKKQNADFFSKMNKQLEEEGGYEALLYHLQEIDLTDFEVRNVPQTDALKEQKLLSLDHTEEWWYRKLNDGKLLESHSEWATMVSCKQLENDFTNYSNNWSVARRGSATSLGRFLNKVVPHLRRSQKSISVDEIDDTGRHLTVKKRQYVYEFGGLQKCRDEWSSIYGTETWDTPLQYDPKEDNGEPFS